MHPLLSTYSSVHGRPSPKRLVQMLGEALRKQQDQWKPKVYRTPLNEELEVGPESRDNIVSWLVQLNKHYKFHPETMVLSTVILDSFLSVVKARPKYLRCIGIACFYLAAKTLEEDEVVPSTLDFVQKSECGCSVAEVLRMERVVLDKLQWQLMQPTAVEFMHIFHAAVLSKSSHLLDHVPHVTPSRQLSILTEKLLRCVGSHRFLSYKPSTMAVALVSLELEQFTTDWLAATLWLQALSRTEQQDLIACREDISSFLSADRCPSLTYLGTPTKATKRKMDDMEEEDDTDMYEGIKRLYNEDAEGSQIIVAVCASDHMPVMQMTAVAI